MSEKTIYPPNANCVIDEASLAIKEFADPMNFKMFPELDLVVVEGSEKSVAGEVKIEREFSKLPALYVCWKTYNGQTGNIPTQSLKQAKLLYCRLSYSENKVEIWQARDGKFIKKVAG